MQIAKSAQPQAESHLASVLAVHPAVCHFHFGKEHIGILERLITDRQVAPLEEWGLCPDLPGMAGNPFTWEGLGVLPPVLKKGTNSTSILNSAPPHMELVNAASPRDQFATRVPMPGRAKRHGLPASIRHRPSRFKGAEPSKGT